LKGVVDDHETRIDTLETDNGYLARILGAGAFVKHGIVTAPLTNNVFDFVTVAKITTSPILNRVTLAASSTSPIVLTFSKGYDANGPIVYFGRVTSDQVINLGNNSDALIYAEYNESTGAVTFGATNTTTSHVVSYSDPGTTGYWYSLKDEKLYLWSGSAWVAVVQVVIGKANWSGSGSFTSYQPVGKSIKDIYGRGQVPAGTVSAFAGATAPDGFLLCNGGAISRAIYSDLFVAIGTTYGAGNGTTTFNLPDLRSEFIRGLDAGRGVDVARTLGSNQTGSILAIDSTGTNQIYSAVMTSTGFTPGDPELVAQRTGLDYDPNGATNYPDTIAAYSNGDGTGGFYIGVVRPRNVAMNYIIKF
jgi:microcystin-dependent protein